MKLFAPAKVNLYLRITGRRDDGYHLLDSLMVPISLGDEVEVIRSEGAPGCVTVCADDPAVPLGEENTAHRAARAFQNRTGRREPVTVSIRKRIPMGAGLGGGSTDAAATLRGMNDLFDVGLSDQDLEELALTVGADVPFFIRGVAARARGIGERLTPLGAYPPATARILDRVRSRFGEQPNPPGSLPRLWMVVLFPGFPVSTAWVYRNFRFKLTKPSNNNNLLEKVDTLDDVAQVMVNDLETVTIGRYPRIARLKDRLNASGAIGSLMSGSGSAVFGLFASEADASKAFAGFDGEKDIRAYLAFSLT